MASVINQTCYNIRIQYIPFEVCKLLCILPNETIFNVVWEIYQFIEKNPTNFNIFGPFLREVMTIYQNESHYLCFDHCLMIEYLTLIYYERYMIDSEAISQLCILCEHFDKLANNNKCRTILEKAILMSIACGLDNHHYLHLNSYLFSNENHRDYMKLITLLTKNK